MRYICTCLYIVLCSCKCFAQAEIFKRIVLIGNAREAVKDNNHFLDAIKESIAFDSNTIVLYLGNNSPAPDDTIALSEEARIINNSPARAFFIPGYGDWANGTEAGNDAVLKQQRFLQGFHNDHIRFYPGNGCPGPKEIDLGNDAVMLIMDSQWWLHKHNKPDIESDCKYRTKEEVLAEIEDYPKDNADKLILLVTHHPLENTGVHSGTFGLKQHVFPLTDLRRSRWLYLPLPVIGSAYPIMRNGISSNQDMHNDVYQSLAASGIGNTPGIKKAFKDHPFTIFISGQEHNLQLLKKGLHYFINSGASGKAGRVRHGKNAMYVKQKTGFAVLEITTDKKVRAKFYVVSGHTVKEDYAAQLADYSKVPPLAKDTTTLSMIDADSITARADERIAHTTVLNHLLVGENYRKEWGADVRMKVLHMDKEKGGLRITGMGGGHESRSLRFEDAAGKKWVFRSFNKNLEAVIPEGFHETIASEFVHDILSGSDPYGAMVVPDLQRPLNIIHAKPEIYFIPNDTALGAFRPLFANTTGLLEERKPGGNKSGLINTTEAFNNMVKASDHFSDQRAYLKIRLIDFLISDFDRHHGQFSWGRIDSGGRKFYYPVPRDRDQALYNNNGFIMSILRHGGYKFMTNFTYSVKRIKNNGIVGAYLDMLFLNSLSEKDWRQSLDEFRTNLTDSVINTAVHRLPPQIYAIRGPEINAKLISRVKSIADNGMDYYTFISKKVNVLGGNKDERFMVSGSDSGLLVRVYAKDAQGAPSLRYARNFDPAVTKEVRLYGFNGNDYFDIDETAKSRIRLRIVGGKGNDTFNVRGRVKNYLYDLSLEHNELLARKRTTKMFSRNPSVNEFKFRENVHNAFDLPIVTVGVNKEDGLVAGIALAYRTQGFRKYPYASLQRLSAGFAFMNKAYQVKYSGAFINVFRHYDLVLNAAHFNPVLNNFYGFGNETVKDPDKELQYYRTKYSYSAADILGRKRLLNDNVMSISAGPSVYYYRNDPDINRSRVLEHPSVVGLDSASVYSRKFYAGGKLAFAINNLKNELLPVRGINWTTEFTGLKALNESADPFTKLSSSLDVYAVLNEPNQLLAALHVGGGHIFSDHFEYFQALTLGGNNYLRGYRVNRFSGSSMAYASAELKVKLFDFNAYVVRGDFGLVGFNDVGRVWVEHDLSQKWHHGYGGGIYLIPFNTLMLSAVAGFSEEDTLFNLTLGTKLNMVFQGL